MIFIRLYGSIGACIGTILAEFSIAIYQTISVSKELNICVYIKDFLFNFTKAIIMGIVIGCISYLVDSMYVRIISDIFVAIILFVILDRKYIFNVFLCNK